MPQKIDSSKPFVFSGTPLTPNKTALDFWRWALSDTSQNITRGILAEYIVALAINADAKPRDPWRSWDLEKGDFKIEVKNTSETQAWSSKKKTRLSVTISLAKEYATATGKYLEPPKLNAHAYVICYLRGDKPDPFDVSQWTFYVLPQEEVRRRMQNKKTAKIYIDELPNPLNFSQLDAQITKTKK